MAPKAKRTALQLPAIGDVVEITWRDSGVSSARTGLPPELVTTITITNWGKVCSISDDDIVIAYSESSDGDLSNSEHWAIWIPAIVPPIKVLQKST